MNTNAKTITVVSGKGGTGKTTVVSSLASLAESCVLADCDVDAADLHLILKPESSKVNTFRGSRMAQVNYEQCMYCGMCADLCRFDAIHINPDGKPIVEEISCEGCGVCEWFCPSKAIELAERDTGEWFISETKYGKMVHARLGIGSENSGRLVTIVRNMAQGLADANEKNYVIIDGSPGVGCPVIASVTGIDYALIVTEPTMSGLHDLKRISELTEYFRVKTGICINKYDLNLEMTDQIKAYGKEKNIAVVGKIPFDFCVTDSILKGVPVTETEDNHVSVILREMWDHIQNSLN